MSDLAGALNNLGVRYAELGPTADALAATQAAMTLYRDLAPSNGPPALDALAPALAANACLALRARCERYMPHKGTAPGGQMGERQVQASQPTGGLGTPDSGENRTWLALTWLGLALAALVAMAQVGAIVVEVTPAGQYTVTALYGPGQLLATNLTVPTTTLNAWAQATAQFGGLPAWLYLHLLFDVAFIVGYGLLGFKVLPRGARAARVLLAIVIAADGAEDIIAAVAFLRVWQQRHALFLPTLILHVATVVKWLAVAAFFVWVAYRAWDSDRIRREVRQLASALQVQRFSLVVVAVLAVIAVGRGPDVLEQMPDVQRAWLTWPPGMGWVAAAVAVAAQLLLALLLAFLGRLRTRRAADKFIGPDQRGDPRYLPWLLTPAALAMLAVVLRLTGFAEIGWWRLVTVTMVPALIAGASIIIDRYHRPQSGVPPLGHRLPPPQPEVVSKARTVGDALAAAAVAVTGLGLVRSFTAPALVSGGGYAWASAVAVVIGFTIAVVTWQLANGPVRAVLRGLASQASGRRLLARLAYWASRGQLAGVSGPWRGLWPWLVVGAPFLTADALLLFVPLATTHWLGVLGTVVITVGTLAVGLAVLAYLAQTHRPLPLFRILRLNVTPVITLIVIIGLLGAALDSKPLAHVIRGPVAGTRGAAGTQSGGASLLTGLQSWLKDARTSSCAVSAVGEPTAGKRRPVRVEPLILVAAAGGVSARPGGPSGHWTRWRPRRAGGMPSSR